MTDDEQAAYDAFHRARREAQQEAQHQDRLRWHANALKRCQDGLDALPTRKRAAPET